ncbi:MAG: hypothetical protein LLG44_12935 [Chloroflexi bacterium]|nr:hypothetical protein [Chloroflexota bacterium]
MSIPDITAAVRQYLREVERAYAYVIPAYSAGIHPPLRHSRASTYLIPAQAEMTAL